MPVEHTDVGAYALGLLEEADRRAFEAHLAVCASCSAELERMGAVTDALRELRGDHLAPVDGGESADR